LEPVRNRSASLITFDNRDVGASTGKRVLYEPAVTSWLVQFGQRTALMGISV